VGGRGWGGVGWEGEGGEAGGGGGAWHVIVGIAGARLAAAAAAAAAEKQTCSPRISQCGRPSPWLEGEQHQDWGVRSRIGGGRSSRRLEGKW